MAYRPGSGKTGLTRAQIHQRALQRAAERAAKSAQSKSKRAAKKSASPKKSASAIPKKLSAHQKHVLHMKHIGKATPAQLAEAKKITTVAKPKSKVPVLTTGTASGLAKSKNNAFISKRSKTVKTAKRAVKKTTTSKGDSVARRVALFDKRMTTVKGRKALKAK